MEEFLELESFKRIFCRGDNESTMNALHRASNSIELCNKKFLIDLIHKFTGKWPHNQDKASLISGVKRLVQSRFYKDIFGKDKPESVEKKDALSIANLMLKDEKKEHEPKIMVAVVDEKPKDKPKKEKKIREKVVKHKSEFSQKVSGMSKDDLLAWAKEVGVDQAKIDKHLNKPLGLFKMNIGNLIRNKLG